MNNKKIAIITIKDDNNLGNRLQNFAMQNILEKKGFVVYSVIRRFNYENISFFHNVKYKLKFPIFVVLSKFSSSKNKYLRKKNFLLFNRNIKCDKHEIRKKTNLKKLSNKYDYFVAGSDQIWNPSAFLNNMYVNLLGFTDRNKKIAIAPSIALDKLTVEQETIFKNYLKDFDALSCREEIGSTIIENLTGKKCITLIDPTLMINKFEWMKISKKCNLKPSKSYVLIYFLAKQSKEIYIRIKKFCSDNNLEIVDINDSKSKYYFCGPSEFLDLINTCSIVFTDSFHGSIFAYIFEKPLYIFSRPGCENMNSRILNLINIFYL